MTNYYFADISYHKGYIDPQRFADQGHRVLILKTSDGYHMPDENGKYDLALERHHDITFVPQFVAARKSGFMVAGYHFARFNMPWGAKRSVIIEKNIEYYLQALDMLPPGYRQETDTCGILDMEQPGKQLKAAGLSKGDVSTMAIEIGKQFKEKFKYLIFYSGSWWSDEWLNDAACKWFAENTTCWEPEYAKTDIRSLPVNPDYRPSVPKRFSNEYATEADDSIGKLFAWQYTEGGRVPGVKSNIDLNQTRMSVYQISKMFGQSVAFVPPHDKSYYRLRQSRYWHAGARLLRAIR